MKKTVLFLSLLLGSQQLQAQLPTNSFAVTSACPASAANPSVLQQVNTDGSLTPIATITDGTNPLILNALGFDDANPTVLYAMNVQQPVTMANFDAPPTLYRVELGTGLAAGLGTVTPPPAPTTGLSPLAFGEFVARDIRQTFNFIGDGGASSEYYVGGATARVIANAFTFSLRVADLRLYVGTVQLAPFTSAAPAWKQLDTSDPATAAVVAGYQAQVQAYLASGGNGPTPEGGIQDWVYDARTGNLVSYLGLEDKFLTITNPATAPAGRTTVPDAPIPTQQNIGAMFTDRLGNVYAVEADGGTIYKIDRLTGNYSGRSYGSAFGCSRGDAVSLPGALPLPVTLVRFAALPTAGGGVRFEWQTSHEQAAAYFEVERSPTATEWQPVARVAASNQTTGQRYTATDPNPYPGQTYYRLAMHDADGSVTYSTVQVTVPTGAALAVAYPNPAREELRVVLANPALPGALSLVDGRGQVVRRLQATGSSGPLKLPTAGLAPGLYLLRVQQGSHTSTTRVVLEGSGQ
ncbi:T9SS type A sorting domain-containing protein [Hymenobacter sp. HSC-4F20]|uniref:T9SS type A sorting domain-containing protein n=1 Tax=Hymenobacter sp. HSC-4F20 TaxID=2864135 RepID=UPI001C7381C1|nr:T9SS type A sorting domain-containing protein [Hymenobacter sp. HSC-4F20]MBX0290319.1 T9SS type A sorting domain-containing protein [Hymenobacter sp. HSC-4F20]